jgi:hypothetical protein
MDGIPISDAAQQLGISAEAIRKRIGRGTMHGYKVDGQWYVTLDGPAGYAAGHPDGHPNATTGQRQDTHPDGAAGVYRELVDQQRTEIARLVEQLNVKDEQLQQANVIIMRLSERVAELPAPASQPQPEAPAESTPPRRRWWQWW